MVRDTLDGSPQMFVVAHHGRRTQLERGFDQYDEIGVCFEGEPGNLAERAAGREVVEVHRDHADDVSGISDSSTSTVPASMAVALTSA